MAISTFDELKTAIEDWLDDSNLAGRVEDFIALAEARHRVDIRIREMVTRATASFTSRFVALPAGFLEMQHLRLQVPTSEGGGYVRLRPVSVDDITRWIDTVHHGRPRFYAVHEEIELDRVEDASRTLEMVYYKAFDALSDGNPSNALLARASSAYLYAALLEAEPFLGNDPRLQLWAEMYASIRERLNTMDRRRAGPLASQVVGTTP